MSSSPNKNKKSARFVESSSRISKGGGSMDTADQPKAPPRRRVTVFAESHNPEKVSKLSIASFPSFPKTDRQRRFLLKECNQCVIFKNLEKEDMEEVVGAMQEMKVAPGQILIRQGDEGDNCYIVESGVFEAYVTDKKIHKSAGSEGIPAGSVKVKEYNGSGVFGELALLYSTPRAATVIAKTEGVVWALDRIPFQKMVLVKTYARRQQHIQFLGSVPLLKELQQTELLNVAEALNPRTYEDGEQIIAEGSPGHEMYFVEEGEVRICCSGSGSQPMTSRPSVTTESKQKQSRKSLPGAEKELCRVQKGGYFGELALITKKPRAASAYAVGAVKLAVLDVDSFERLLGPCKAVMQRNMKEYEEQYKKLMASDQI